MTDQLERVFGIVVRVAALITAVSFGVLVSLIYVLVAVFANVSQAALTTGFAMCTGIILILTGAGLLAAEATVLSSDDGKPRRVGSRAALVVGALLVIACVGFTNYG